MKFVEGASLLHQQGATITNVFNSSSIIRKAEVTSCLSSGLSTQHGEFGAWWGRPKTCENVRWNSRRVRPGPGGPRDPSTGKDCCRSPVIDPVVRRCLRAVVSALLVSGHEHPPETHRPAARVSEQEEDGDKGGAGGRAPQVLSKVLLFFPRRRFYPVNKAFWAGKSTFPRTQTCTQAVMSSSRWVFVSLSPVF